MTAVKTTAVDTITPIDKNEMTGLATTEYERLLGLLDSLEPDQWGLQTVCDDWDVREMVAHLLGAAESNASVRETIRQVRRGSRWAKEAGRPQIDGINAVQIDDRRHLAPEELTARLRAVAPKAVAGRRRFPRLLRGMPADDPLGGKLTMGHLMDVIYTRDQWMHRVDISLATGRDLVLTADHDGRIVADVVREWADLHGRPFTLELTGPAGGTFTAGAGGPHIRLDAVEFCLIVSGRRDRDLPISQMVLF